MKLQNHFGRFFRKKNLAVSLKGDYLYLALTDKKGIEKPERIFLRETPLETVREKTTSFLKNAKPQETHLILSRSEVLQKEFSINGREGRSLKDSLETELDQVLPCGRKEMAFGLALLPDSQAFVLAVPEKYVNEKLKFLASLGLTPTEIITEDQPLFWMVEERNNSSSFLLLDSDSERTLVLLGNLRHLIFSRSFPKKDPSDPELLNEVSMNLLERGVKPEKIFLSGRINQEIARELSNHFGIPVEPLSFSENHDTEIPTSFYGVHLYERRPLLSLLPQEEKMKKRRMTRKKQFISIGAAFLLFSLSPILYFTLHLHSLSREAQRLNREITTLLPQAKEVKEIQAFLTTLSESRKSKEKSLELLKDLALNLPQAVSLKEISLSGNQFFFKGESSSHTYLSQTVDALTHLTYLSEIKLGETRLRKRLSEEYFEFEITGRWNP